LQKAKALFDELAVAGKPISLAEFKLCDFEGYAVSLRISSPACPLRMLPSSILISIAAFLHMSFFTKPLFNHL
jgi:hypothetical protein